VVEDDNIPRVTTASSPLAKVLQEVYGPIAAAHDRKRLKEVFADLVLAQGTKEKGKKRKLDRLWTDVAAVLRSLSVPQGRIDDLLQQRNPDLLGELIKELEATAGSQRSRRRHRSN
jgi:hypothetical protein